MHILNNSWINEFWYGFLVLIGAVIAIIFYVQNKRRSFNKLLILLFFISIFAVGIHKLENPVIGNPFELKGISGIEDDNFGTSPDYLGNAVEKIIDFVKKKFLSTPL